MSTATLAPSLSSSFISLMYATKLSPNNLSVIGTSELSSHVGDCFVNKWLEAMCLPRDNSHDAWPDSTTFLHLDEEGFHSHVQPLRLQIWSACAACAQLSSQRSTQPAATETKVLCSTMGMIITGQLAGFLWASVLFCKFSPSSLFEKCPFAMFAKFSLTFPPFVLLHWHYNCPHLKRMLPSFIMYDSFWCDTYTRHCHKAWI